MRSQIRDSRAEAFRAIAACIEAVEATASEIRDVTLANEDPFTEETLSVEFEVTLPEISKVARLGLRPKSDALTVTNDGICLLAFTVDIPLHDSFRSSATGDDSISDLQASFDIVDQFEPVESEPGDGDQQDQSTVPEASPHGPPESGSSSSDTKGSSRTSESGPELEIPYRDPDRLKSVYDEYETFEEMRDALGVDVTPQTVRRHMIKHGIHEVSTNPVLEALQKYSSQQPSLTASQSQSESTIPVGPLSGQESRRGSSQPDGSSHSEVFVDVDLPGGILIEEVREAVATSRTVYEVQRQLNLEREETCTILRELNLLDLVSGRLESSDGRDRSQEVIDARIHDALEDR